MKDHTDGSHFMEESCGRKTLIMLSGGDYDDSDSDMNNRESNLDIQKQQTSDSYKEASLETLAAENSRLKEDMESKL